MWRVQAVKYLAPSIVVDKETDRAYFSPMASPGSKTRTSFWRAVNTVVVLTILLVLGGCVRIPLNEDILFQPKESVTLGSFAHADAAIEEVFFESVDGTRINAWYLSRPDARATVLFFGGYGFYLVQSRPYLDHFLEQEVNVLLVDYRGYGRSEGQPSVPALKQDAVRAWETLTQDLNADPATVIVHGHSLGTFMAMYVAEQYEAAALVLENPATSAEDWVRVAVPWYLRLIVSFDIAESFRTEDNLARIETVEEHLLLFAGQEDMITPPSMAQQLHDVASVARSRELVLIEGGSHPDLYEFHAYGVAYRRLVDRLSPAAAISLYQ